MTNQVARLYALAAAVPVFFVAWATVAAHPWQSHKAAASDPRVAALQLREQRIQAEVARGEARRRPALGHLPRAALRPQAAGGAARLRARRRRPARPCRDPAAGDDHEDLVMEKHAFNAMGTEVELLLDARRAPRAERLRPGRARVRAAGSPAIALPP